MYMCVLPLEITRKNKQSITKIRERFAHIINNCMYIIHLLLIVDPHV